MYEKVEHLMKQRGVTPYRVAKDLGFSTGLFTDWKKGRYTPKQDKITALAEYFDVPVSYFYAPNEREREEYIDTLANRILNEIFANESLKTLFDLAYDAPEEDIQLLIDILKRMKQ